jgi:flagellar export protein FliJ
MAFKFRLEKVLKYRQQIVDNASREVAKANQQVQAIQGKIDDLCDDIAEQEESNFMQGEQLLQVQDLAGRAGWLEHLHSLKTEMELEKAEARIVVEDQMLRLNEAYRELEVLNKLKDRQKRLWEKSQRARENKEFDEIAQIRASRKSRNKVPV